MPAPMAVVKTLGQEHPARVPPVAAAPGAVTTAGTEPWRRRKIAGPVIFRRADNPPDGMPPWQASGHPENNIIANGVIAADFLQPLWIKGKDS